VLRKVFGSYGDSEANVTGREGGDWFHLAQNRVQWQTLTNMVMEIWVPKRTEISELFKLLLTLEERRCPVEL
jgi:hypothetical protein